jgi:beta-glucosidase
MKRIFLFLILVAGLFCSCNTTPKLLQLTADNIDVILDSLTLEEKVHLLVGTGMAGFSGDSAVVGATKNLVPGAAGTTCPIPRLGIPAIVLADGPAGLRIQPTREGDSATYYCTAFPVATLLASTWNTELVENVGDAIGGEVLEYGADVLLAPALNIHRNPLCGRNFEYYSEDPLLSGKTAAAIVRGIQSNGVGTSIKHFAANNQETNRQKNDVQVSQRALREIYLKGFEIAVKESQPWTVMTSYNKINGTAASESSELLTGILRNEWGFKGAVMTDWYGGYNAVNQMIAGNDLLMPGRPDQYGMIVEAVKSGKLNVDFINRNVRRMLELIVRSPRFKGYKFTNKPDLKTHAEVTRQSALEGMILLENRRNVLPFSEKIKKIAAFGITSYDFIAGGTGSGDVNEAYTVSLGEGLKNAGYEIDGNLKTLYDNHIAVENEKNKPDPKNPFAMFMPKVRAAELLPDAAVLAQAIENNDIALITIGRTSGEFADRKTADFYLNETEKSLVKNVCEASHKAGKKAVVILNVGGVVETASWKTLPDAVLLAWQAGQEGGNSVADILRGAANPSGKLPMTFPVKLEDVPSYANFPRDYTPDSSELLGGSEISANRPNIDFTRYEEDIFVGYRYYLTENKAVSYPFGYGLSYTTFEYGTPGISGKDGDFTIKIPVKNNGRTAGKEVVELYLAAPKGDMVKPARELKAYAKTKLLKAGESQVIELQLTPADFASFDETKTAWIAAAGNYEIKIGSSAIEILQSVSVNLPKEMEVERTHNVLNAIK